MEYTLTSLSTVFTVVLFSLLYVYISYIRHLEINFLNLKIFFPAIHLEVFFFFIKPKFCYEKVQKTIIFETKRKLKCQKLGFRVTFIFPKLFSASSLGNVTFKVTLTTNNSLSNIHAFPFTVIAKFRRLQLPITGIYSCLRHLSSNFALVESKKQPLNKREKCWGVIHKSIAPDKACGRNK